jgi:urease accessory protein
MTRLPVRAATRPAALLPFVLFLTGEAAFAHSGAGHASGFGMGLVHPVVGFDHLLAMVAVGLWSGLALRRRVWLGAAVFMGAMLGGALVGLSFGSTPLAEPGILASVVLFGLLAAVAHPAQRAAITGVSLVAIGGFALFHGQAHAAEASGAIGPYVLGFLLSTAALHLSGIALARTVAARSRLRQAAGGAIALAGLALALS